MESGHADQKPLGECELRCQQGVFAGHRMRRVGWRVFGAKGKAATEDGVDQVVLKNVRLAANEWGEVTVMGLGVAGGEALQDRSGTVADARGEGLHALDEPGPDV
jgi:hypothetical protein